jgi:hypothetical protein
MMSVANTRASERQESMNNFLDYAKQMWPEFLCGPHHELMAEKFEGVAAGKIKKLILNLPPRHTKSMFASYLLPSWYLGRFPEKQVIQTMSDINLAVGFGRLVDRLMGSQEYAQVFPKHGKNVCTGVGGAIGGHLADLLIVDDPHLAGFNDFTNVFDWFAHSAMCGLNPEGAIVVVMSRSSADDLTGQLEGFGEWEVLKIPAMQADGSATWPEFWPEKDLLDVKKNVTSKIWAMQWQQNVDEAA